MARYTNKEKASYHKGIAVGLAKKSSSGRRTRRTTKGYRRKRY